VTVTVTDAAGETATTTVHVLEALEIAAGDLHTCARIAVSTGGPGNSEEGVRCWGRNNVGQIGDGQGTNEVWTPVPVTDNTGSPLTGVSQIAAGKDHNCAVTGSGKELWCWGANASFQLAAGSNYYSRAILTKDLSGTSAVIESLTLGDKYTCYQKNDSGTRSTHCVGSHISGELGDGTTAGGTSSTFSTVSQPGGFEFIALGGGANHVCGVGFNGSSAYNVYCWGSDSDEQLGNGTPTGNQTSFQAASTGVFTQSGVVVGAGDKHTCAAGSGGSVTDLYCWGNNTPGQLGLTGGTKDTPTKLAAVTGASGWDKLAVGAMHTCATDDTKKELYCWGEATDGQLGTGSTGDTNIPGQVLWDSSVGGGVVDYPTAISAGRYHTCFIESGNVFCFGCANSGIHYGQCSTSTNKPMFGVFY